jgi:hypothetical protein
MIRDGQTEEPIEEELTGDQPDEITALAVTEGGELILNGDGAADEEN